MKIKLDTPLVINSDHDVILPVGDQLHADIPILIACDDEQVANELFSYIKSNYSPNKTFTSEEFNAALDHALSRPEHRVKSCNLAMAIFNHGGCLVAQMGKSRVLQVRPNTQEIEYDSRTQVLDIYSSKAKVEQIKYLRTNDYIVLCTAENIDAKAIQKTMCNVAKDDNAKLAEIAQILKPATTHTGNSPALLLMHVEEVRGCGVSMPSFSFLKPKYVLYTLLAAMAIGTALWVINSNPFSWTEDAVTVDPDSLVTDKAPNNAKISFVVDSADLKAEQDSLRGQQLKKDSLARMQKQKQDSIKKVELEKRKLEADKKAKAAQEAKEMKTEPQVRDLKPITPSTPDAPAVQAPPVP